MPNKNLRALQLERETGLHQLQEIGPHRLAVGLCREWGLPLSILRHTVNCKTPEEIYANVFAERKKTSVKNPLTLKQYKKIENRLRHLDPSNKLLNGIIQMLHGYTGSVRRTRSKRTGRDSYASTTYSKAKIQSISRLEGTVKFIFDKIDIERVMILDEAFSQYAGKGEGGRCNPWSEMVDRHFAEHGREPGVFASRYNKKHLIICRIGWTKNIYDKGMSIIDRDKNGGAVVLDAKKVKHPWINHPDRECFEAVIIRPGNNNGCRGLVTEKGWLVRHNHPNSFDIVYSKNPKQGEALLEREMVDNAIDYLDLSGG